VKRSQPQRQWDDARAKVEREGQCRVCGTPYNVEAAHTVGREHDAPKPGALCHGDGVVPVELEPMLRQDVEWPIPWCPLCNGRGTLTPDVLWVNPDDVIPLCGPATSTGTCHGKDHAHQLDLAPYLSEREQQRVVKHLKTIEAARVRVAPSEYRVAV
jgi:hypothetical protein